MISFFIYLTVNGPFSSIDRLCVDFEIPGSFLQASIYCAARSEGEYRNISFELWTNESANNKKKRQYSSSLCSLFILFTSIHNWRSPFFVQSFAAHQLIKWLLFRLIEFAVVLHIT